MLAPDYDCLFHEHRGDKGFGCRAEGEEGVRGIVGKAWVCFEGGWGVRIRMGMWMSRCDSGGLRS